ncbi:MAG: RusA family crossover junction endodeoxyribonuclease [Ruminococcaceae bacterium]|nr:RusA family crossover junction endodeoxyribonuclease [Oscillospiraceae bacterium]
MKIVVNDIPPSNNQFIGRNKIWEYQDYKKTWHWLIKSAIKNKPKEPYEKAIVKITYHFADNIRRDPDNYSGKMILDPLVHERIIADDSFKNISLVLGATFGNKHKKIEIEITEV